MGRVTIKELAAESDRKLVIISGLQNELDKFKEAYKGIELENRLLSESLSNAKDTMEDMSEQLQLYKSKIRRLDGEIERHFNIIENISYGFRER